MGTTRRGHGGRRSGALQGLGAAGPPASGDNNGMSGTEAGSQKSPTSAWPTWARILVSLAVVYHLAAIVAGAVGVPPSSELERAVADGFTSYYDLMDLGYSYRFYAEPGPTPVVTATIQYADGRPEETVRLPGREVAGPRMRHQRQLALANALFNDVQEARHRVEMPRRAGWRGPMRGTSAAGDRAAGS